MADSTETQRSLTWQILDSWCREAGPAWHTEPSGSKNYRLQYEGTNVLYCYDTKVGATVFVENTDESDLKEIGTFGEFISHSRGGLRMAIVPHRVVSIADWAAARKARA